MLSSKQQQEIARLINEGYRDSYIAKKIGASRSTVGKYRIKFLELQKKMGNEEELEDKEFSIMFGDPENYKEPERKRPRLTPEAMQRIDKILKDGKANHYGAKDRLNVMEIHRILKGEGYDIGYGSVWRYVKNKSEAIEEEEVKEPVNQASGFGERLEYDFGDYKVMIEGKITKIYIAVFYSPATGFIDYHVYLHRDYKSFSDSHVRFFKEHGTCRQIVYNSARSLVRLFVGQNERELTDLVMNLSSEYGYEIILSNSLYADNERRNAEGGKDFVAALFEKQNVFDSWYDLAEYVSRSSKYD